MTIVLGEAKDLEEKHTKNQIKKGNKEKQKEDNKLFYFIISLKK
jgi:hypothetical protein